MIDRHRGAFEYDWRARFHLPVSVVGKAMSWGEALRLTGILLSDPSSQVAAQYSGWDHPLSRELILLLDLFDLGGYWAAGKKHEPHPMRPVVKKKRKAPVLSQAQILKVLRDAGHTLPDPA